MSNQVMVFSCGLCQEVYADTRKGLRKHLKTHLRKELANFKVSSGKRKDSKKQDWWIVKEFKGGDK